MKWRWAYPNDWERLAYACKDQAGWQCEECGGVHQAYTINMETGEVKRVILCAAHLDHDIWNPCPHLKALCRSCHARYDHSQQERARWLALERMRHQWLLKRWNERQHLQPRGRRANPSGGPIHEYV